MNKKVLSDLKEHKAPTETLPVCFIISSSIELVDSKEILFVSLWSQEKNKRNKYPYKADYKIFISKSDDNYITQVLLDDGTYKWSNASLRYLLNYDSTYYYGYYFKSSCDRLYDKENIENYFNTKFTNVGDELTFILIYQENILDNRLKDKYKKITDKIDKAMDLVSSLPKGFDKWIYNNPFDFSRYLFYKRIGNKINGYCTYCRNHFTIIETKKTKKLFKNKVVGKCTNCNKKVTFISAGVSKNISDYSRFSIIQKYNGGLIIRYFYGYLSYSYNDSLKNICDRKIDIQYFEFARKILKNVEYKDLSISSYVYKEFRQTGNTRWCNENYSHFDTPPTYLYTKNLYSVLKNTVFEFSYLYDYAKYFKKLYVLDFLIGHTKQPALEFLIKLKLFDFVKSCFSSYGHKTDLPLNLEGKSIQKIFGFNKTVLYQMQRLKLGKNGFYLLKNLYSHHITLPDNQIKYILENSINNHFPYFLEFSTPARIFKYIKSQSNKDYSLCNVMIDWKDYINQCIHLEYDLQNDFILYPADLKSRHEEYTLLTKVKNVESYKEAISNLYESFNRYSFTSKQFIIRPAFNHNEIIKEGHSLVHCVGSTHYFEGMKKGEFVIFFIREINSPDTSFFTLQLDCNELEILQCRGHRNCDMPIEIKSFVDIWKRKVLKSVKIA